MCVLLLKLIEDRDHALYYSFIISFSGKVSTLNIKGPWFFF